MAENSKIEWTDASWTPIRARNRKTGKVGWHCEHATMGCVNCYSEGFNLRLGTGLPFKPGHREDIDLFLDEEMLLAPLRWRRARMVFVCSMTDLFADFVSDEWIDRIFAVMALCPQHTFQVLTKRAKRMREYLIRLGDGPDGLWPAVVSLGEQARARRGPDVFPLPNVWCGVSAERQQEADERIPDLLVTPAAVRFVSYEPALGPLELWRWDEDEGALRGVGVIRSGGMTASTPDSPPEGYDDSYPGIDWVICGGESGPGARPMHPDWARSVRDQCTKLEVPFFFKQWGAWAEWPDFESETAESLELQRAYEHFPVAGRDGVHMRRVGKKAAGRLLDGREWNEMPSSETAP